MVTAAVSKWENDQTCPDISALPKLARLLGGAEITDAVRENAKEMKRLALKLKSDRLKIS